MVMALPFWIAMATECSTSVAASSRDQRDGCSDAAPLIRSSRGEGVRAESSARLDSEGKELSVVAAGDGCVLLAVSCLLRPWQLRARLLDVDGLAGG